MVVAVSGVLVGADTFVGIEAWASADLCQNTITFKISAAIMPSMQGMSVRCTILKGGLEALGEDIGADQQRNDTGDRLLLNRSNSFLSAVVQLIASVVLYLWILLTCLGLFRRVASRVYGRVSTAFL
jgi:hypothetical protein